MKLEKVNIIFVGQPKSSGTEEMQEIVNSIAAGKTFWEGFEYTRHIIW